MCGIVGVFGSLTFGWVNTFRDLLFVDQLRGMDSTGVLVASVNGQSLIHKAVGGVTKWQDSLDYNTDFQMYTFGMGLNANLLLGHNRKATMGAITEENAHPHRVKSIVGVHNGTLDWSSMSGFVAYKQQSDSLCLFSEIAEKGVEHAYEKTRGAMALVWWDMSNQTLYMLRNSDRPLWVYYDPKQDVMAWSSEKWMLEICTDRNKITMDPEATFKELPINELFSFRFRPQRDKGKQLSLRNRTLTPVKAHGYNTGPFVHRVTTTPVLSATVSPARSMFRGARDEPTLPKGGVVGPYAAYCGPNHTNILATDWLRLMAQTDCAWCGSPMGGLSWSKDRYNVIWISSTDALCPECAQDKEVKSYLHGML